MTKKITYIMFFCFELISKLHNVIACDMCGLCDVCVRMLKCYEFDQTRTCGRRKHEFRKGSQMSPRLLQSFFIAGRSVSFLSCHSASDRDIMCCCFFVVLFCRSDCRSHCSCSCCVGLKPFAFATQPKLRIVCPHGLRQFCRLLFVWGQKVNVAAITVVPVFCDVVTRRTPMCMLRPISLSRTARVSHVFCENDYYVDKLTSFTVECQADGRSPHPRP